MKTKKSLYYFLMILPLVLTLLALPFLPDQIPAHYDISNQVDRWGSKFETLILPVMVVLFGGFMLLMAKYASKQEKSGRNNEKICITAGLSTLVLFNGMTLYFLYTAFRQVESLSALTFDINQLVFCILGLSLMIMGNVMPKLRMNALIGLRTSWSMENEVTWKKSQRFGGISFILAGLVMMMVSCFVRGLSCGLWCLGILLAVTAVDVFYTYRVAKKYADK